MRKLVSLKQSDGTWQSLELIRLLAITYKPLEDYDGSYIACPKDGDYFNTTLSNVVWRARSDFSSDIWKSGKITRRPRKSTCCTEESKRMVLDALSSYDEPVTMVALHTDLEVPYSVVRYSMLALIDAGLARKTGTGYVLCGREQI